MNAKDLVKSASNLANLLMSEAKTDHKKHKSDHKRYPNEHKLIALIGVTIFLVVNSVLAFGFTAQNFASKKADHMSNVAASSSNYSRGSHMVG